MWWLLACAGSGPPDLVLISIDGMRADHAHFNGYPAQTTPSLDDLAREGVNFPLAFSASNESLYSHAALLSGLDAPEVARMDYATFTVPPAVATLAEALGAEGYHTGGFVAGGHVKAVFGLDQGFQTWWEGPDFGSFHDTVPPALAWMASAPGPRFLFVHGYDCHRPYAHASVFYHPFDRGYRSADGGPGPVERWVARRNGTERILDGVHYEGLPMPTLLHAGGVSMSDPAGYLQAREAAARIPPWDRTPLTPADLTHLQAHYDSGVLAADTYVGMLLDALRASPRWDRTLVFVTSDHGEDLQDHGFSNHRATVTDATTHVPLLVGGGWLPPEARGRVSDRLVDAVDLVPTLLQAAGVPALADARGVSLLGCLGLPASAGPAPGVAPTAGPVTCDARPYAFQIGVLGQLAARSPTHRLVFQGFAADDPTASRHLAEDPVDGPGFGLYASVRDPVEREDLRAEQPATAAALRAALAAWDGGLRRSAYGEAVPDATRQMLREHGYW